MRPGFLGQRQLKPAATNAALKLHGPTDPAKFRPLKRKGKLARVGLVTDNFMKWHNRVAHRFIGLDAKGCQ
ncbi:MAG: hypothetical protein O3A08_13410 [Proteobacteria bacterium]|nr:hypothetical protein [Pseudomonadota bacterium]